MLAKSGLCIASLLVLWPCALNARPAMSGANTYNIFDLNSISQLQNAEAYGISGNGKITGYSYNPNTGILHAFIYQTSNGTFQDLGMLGSLYGSDGVAINNNGQVSCTAYGPGYYAVRYTNGVIKKLGSIDGGSSEGYSINSSGNIVGRAVNGDGGGQGFSYINGAFSALAVDRAACINDSNQFVGSLGYYWQYGKYVYGVEHAFLSSGGVITDLGNIGGGLKTYTEAFSLNNSGQVTGYSTGADGSQHAFLYTGGVMQDLGTFAPYFTRGVSINSSGVVAGNITNAYGAQIGAFLYQNGTMSNLADLLDGSGEGWDQLTVKQINDSGWIIGTGTQNGETHSFLARPNPVVISSVNPNHGANGGAAGIIINGYGFTGASGVSFGGVAAGFTVNNDSQITANLPSTAKVGWVDITITSTAGTGTISNGYDFYTSPVSYGSPAGAQTLQWDPASWPSIGQTLTFQIQPFAPGSLVWTWAGESNNNWAGIPLPLDLGLYGLPGDTIWAAADYIINTASPSPSIPVAIPNDVTLAARHFYFQSIVFDGSTSAFVSTNAYDVLVGY
ncbi:MAG: IPT/TIG domain-containing protein [Planctomycetes bacterium]|nr:IPT/TIG domain-containing protein [Planctomycetota bacterium]